MIKADEDAAKLGNKADELIARRRELEAEQSALWCKIALRGVSSLELNDHAMYRFDLVISGSDETSHQRLEAVKAGAEFLRRINAAITQVQSDVDQDQKGALDQLQQNTAAARSILERQFAREPLVGAALDDSHSAIGQFSRSARRLADSSHNMVDAYRLAGDGDQQGDPDRKTDFAGNCRRWSSISPQLS